MEKYYNIDEQRQWNDKNMWDVDGHEWSIPFESSDKLWNDYIYDYVKELVERINKTLENHPRKITVRKPENYEFRFAFINCIQKFKLPTINCPFINTFEK